MEERRDLFQHLLMRVRTKEQKPICDVTCLHVHIRIWISVAQQCDSRAGTAGESPNAGLGEAKFPFKAGLEPGCPA
jgi:hypothetical protein